MLFNSIEFLLFLPIVTFFYYIIPPRIRWLFLLGASYLFFISWIPVYIVLILISTLIGYITAIKVENEGNLNVRRRFLYISLFTNLGILILFKYFNFFNGIFRAIWETVGATYPIPDLQLVVPLGISFYTFLILGYSIDVYHRRLRAERNIGIFALFVSFFPQLAAGPIERGRNMLPQFKASHSFDYERVTCGLLRIVWGFYKKVVVADRLGLLVDAVYSNPTAYTGNPLILATFAFSLQIYCDFSAYSDIAIGAAQILGFKLMENFQQPYFSKSVPEFWRTWHISLSTWFRDYIFFPLRRSMLKSSNSNTDDLAPLVVPPLVTMLLSGLWHGANWTFVIWGGIHGTLIVLDMLWNHYKKPRIHLIKLSEHIKSGLRILITFNVITFTWIFFRANSLSDAVYVLQNMFVNLSFKSFGIGQIMPGGKYELFILVCAIAFVGLIDVLQYRKVNLRAFALRLPIWIRWPAYYALILIILIFGKFGLEEFLYIQF
jgi:D-alanyl-lipoteichoic acid acyltransferase DltB (MBOAT superfamily)